MNTLEPYYDLLMEKRQAVKQLKLDTFLKEALQKNSDEPLPSTSSGKTKTPPALFFLPAKSRESSPEVELTQFSPLPLSSQ
jgi:hypothetical protein